MYTWLLWRALQSPPTENPLFLQMQAIVKPSWLDRFWDGLNIVLVLLLFIKPPIFAVIILSIPIFYPMLSSTVYGVLFSMRTSTVIFARRQQGSYDLIRISPVGAWASFWAVCAGSVHRNDDLKRLNHYLKRILTVLFGLGMMLMFASLVMPTEHLRTEFITMVMVVFTAQVLMILELTQSSVLSTLIGILFAITARTTVDSRIGALVGFLMIQLTTYLTSIILVSAFLYPRLIHIEISSVLAVFIGCITLIGYVASLRELVILFLWQLISRQLNTSRDEMQQMVRNLKVRS